MKQVLWGVAIFLVLTTGVRSEGVRTEPVKADSATEDCSKQVWPNFSPSCLRNTDRAVNVRLVTVDRR